MQIKKFDCKYFNSVDLAYENAHNDSKKLILFLLVEVLSLSRNFQDLITKFKFL